MQSNNKHTKDDKKQNRNILPGGFLCTITERIPYQGSGHFIYQKKQYDITETLSVMEDQLCIQCFLSYSSTSYVKDTQEIEIRFYISKEPKIMIRQNDLQEPEETLFEIAQVFLKKYPNGMLYRDIIKMVTQNRKKMRQEAFCEFAEMIEDMLEEPTSNDNSMSGTKYPTTIFYSKRR